MRTLIVVPTYNERENICSFVEALLTLAPDIYVTVVDDSSPDGTSQILEEARAKDPARFSRLSVIVRPGKGGRGGAVREGFARSLERTEKFDIFVEMDSDFSHEPQAVLEGLRRIQTGADIVLGSRYPDGQIIGWPLSRRVFSFLANSLARLLISRAVADYTNGFRFYSQKAVRQMVTIPQRHTGYIYLSESLTHLMKAGLKIEEFPIVFRNRVRGVSNTTLKEIRNALGGLFQIAWEYHSGTR